VRTVARDRTAIFQLGFRAVDRDLLLAAQGQLQEAVADSFARVLGGAPGSVLRSGLALDFDFRNPAAGVVKFDANGFERRVGERFDRFQSLFFERGPGGAAVGVVLALIDALDALEKQRLGGLASGDTRGLLADLTA
jgi:hypothetical protein